VRRSRGSFRRRRRFLPPGRAPGGRKKNWIHRFFPAVSGQILGANEFVDLFELVNQNDYGDAGGAVRREIQHATAVRTVGALEVDLQIEAPGSNGVLWSAAIFVRSLTSVIMEFDGDGGIVPRGSLFTIHPEASMGIPEENLARCRPMAWLPMRSWSGVWLENPTAPAACSDFYSHINRPAQSEPWYFDVTQRRRLTSDESLWLLVSGTFVCAIEDEQPVVNTVLSRTLIYDD